MAKVSTNKSLIIAETNYIKEVIRHAIAYNDKNPKDEAGKPYCSIYAALHKESVDNIAAMGITFTKKKATHHSFYLPKKGTKAYNALMVGSDVVERAAKEKEVKAAALKAAKAEKAAKEKEKAEKKKAAAQAAKAKKAEKKAVKADAKVAKKPTKTETAVKAEKKTAEKKEVKADAKVAKKPAAKKIAKKKA